MHLSNRNKTLGLCISLLACMLLSCTRIENKEDYNNWLNKTRNSCIKEHTINGVNISVKYLPPAYLALKDYSQNGSLRTVHLRDSLLSKYNGMLTFMMTIGPDKSLAKEHQMSMMDEGIQNYSEYVQRVLSANFFMDQHIQLYVDDSAYKPVLAIVENAYELSGSRNFVVAFTSQTAQELLKGKNYLFVYKDPFFNIGDVQFNFSGTDLKAARNLNIIWNTLD